MLSFFKKKNKDLLQNWQIPVDASYRRINNNDSVQFATADENRVLYFSILATDDNQLFSGEALTKMQPSITHLENGWQFKAVKQGGNTILVCVFTFMNEDDITWMKDLFANIVYISK